MIKKFELFIALRYLLSKNRDGFISITALFSFIAIAIGVAVLIIVMSVMGGFRQELLGRILGINGHINIGAYSQSITNYQDIAHDVADIAGIDYAIPLINGQAMLTFNENATGIAIKAMDIADLQKKKIISDNIIQGNLTDMATNNNIIFIGKELAINMGLMIGDKIRLISPKGKTTFVGTIPRIKTYEIGGIFSVGMYEYDNTTILMSLEAAQQYLQLKDAVNMIEITLSDNKFLENVKQEVADIVDYSYYINDWQEINSGFFNALDVERSVMFLILTLIILIAAFNIISSLIMLVNDKKNGIAILRTMGATNNNIIKIFIICGSLIGVIGTILGILIGILFVTNITAIQHFIEKITGNNLFDPVIYFLSELPAILNYNEVMLIIIMSLSISFLSTIYPAWRASKIDPAEILR